VVCKRQIQVVLRCFCGLFSGKNAALGGDTHVVYPRFGVGVLAKYYFFIVEIIIQAKIAVGNGPIHNIHEASIDE
jgi:hypothetical protein